MHPVFVTLVITMTILVHLQTHDDTITEYDAVKSGKFLGCFILVERHPELPLADVDLVFHVVKERLFIPF